MLRVTSNMTRRTKRERHLEQRWKRNKLKTTEILHVNYIGKYEFTCETCKCIVIWYNSVFVNISSDRYMFVEILTNAKKATKMKCEGMYDFKQNIL